MTRPRTVLVTVIGLLLVTELALSPFYPQVLRKLYGEEDPQAVGLLLWACRAAAFAALPLLGLLARRVGLHRIVAMGLVACVALDGALVLAPTATAFVALSAAAAAAGTALLLAYPALVALDEAGGPGVLAFVGLLHAATLAATVLGAAITGLPDPRIGLGAFAVIDLVVLLVVLRHLPGARLRAGERPTRARAPGQPRPAAGIAAVAAVAIVFELAANVIRPFFTAYAEQAGMSLAAAAALFLLPSAAALATLPLAEGARRALRSALLPAALAAAAAGVALQAALDEPAALLAGRLVLGAGLGLAHVEIDRAMFAAVGTDGPGYAAVETVRSGALMLAPVAAAATASSSLVAPLAAGAALFTAAAVLAAVPLTAPRPEEAHVRTR